MKLSKHFLPLCASAIIILLFTSNVAICEEHGPHAGVVRRSGKLITEIKKETDTAFRLYLLDRSWAEIPLEGMSVDVIEKAGKDFKVSCKAEQLSYSCTIPEGAFLSSRGSIEITARKSKELLGQTIYDLPFQSPI